MANQYKLPYFFEYRPRPVSFIRGDFAVYIRNAASYDFKDKIFSLNAASNKGLPIFGGDFYLKKYGS